MAPLIQGSCQLSGEGRSFRAPRRASITDSSSGEMSMYSQTRPHSMAVGTFRPQRSLWVSCRTQSTTRSWRVRPSRTSGRKSRSSFRRDFLRLEFRVELLLHRHALDLHVLRQPILVRRIVFTADQRLEIGAALLGDAEAVLGDV